VNVIGATSGAVWQKFGEINTGAFDNNPFEDIIDNTRIQNEAADILDFSEVNPFGEP
jgi:hypothetical protein